MLSFCLLNTCVMNRKIYSTFIGYQREVLTFIIMMAMPKKIWMEAFMYSSILSRMPKKMMVFVFSYWTGTI